jgi:hypothetical protein
VRLINIPHWLVPAAVGGAWVLGVVLAVPFWLVERHRRTMVKSKP